MQFTKNAENAEHLGLRFPISFFRLKDELDTNVHSISDSATFINNILTKPVVIPSLNT